MADKIQIRRDTAANWTSANPTLAQGELGYETDTDKLKVGDGSTAWTSLGYVIDTGSYLTAANNLSDLGDAATARTNLGLGTAATTASTDYATAAQGALADSALQSIPDNYVLNTGDSITGDLSFGDNVKANFGAGSDLQIYHTGSNSVIREAGTGVLYLQASTAINFLGDTASETLATFGEDGACSFRYDNSTKLATTSTGIDVTGTVETDRATGTVTTDNDLSFDMSATNNFSCTPTGTGTLTFTNITSGQSGNIYLDNSGGHVISAAATTFISAADLTKISTAGKYFVSYYSADGTNVLVSASSAVTASGA
jgi:hypothetical protein